MVVFEINEKLKCVILRKAKTKIKPESTEVGEAVETTATPEKGERQGENQSLRHRGLRLSMLCLIRKGF